LSDLKQRLLERGFEFEFFHALKLLEDTDPQAPPIGGVGPVDQEHIRIRGNRDMAFAPADVSRITRERTPDGVERWCVEQNFMGLYGSASPLPMYIAEMIAQAYIDEDPLRDFFDIFNNRVLSLYYRAWKKHRLSASVTESATDPISSLLVSFLGYERTDSPEEWPVAPERLIRYASLLAGDRRPAGGLETILEDYFGFDDVSITQFVARPVKIAPHERNRVGTPGWNNQLGTSLVLGGTMSDLSGRFRLSVGPLDLGQFMHFQPGEQAWDELVFLVDLYTRRQLGYDIEFRLDTDQATAMMISARRQRNALGRSTWLGVPSGGKVSVLLSPDTIRAPDQQKWERFGQMDDGQLKPDLEVVIKNELGELERLHEIVQQFTHDHRFPPKLTFNFALVLEELLVNTVSYGYDTEEQREIVIRFWMADEWVTIQVEDDAKPFDPFSNVEAPSLYQSVDERQIGGVGIHLIKTMMDDVSYSRVGGKNIVTLRKKVDVESTGQG
jgi:type VI secretion system protein ImpH